MVCVWMRLWFVSECSLKVSCGHGQQAIQRRQNLEFVIGSLPSAMIGSVSEAHTLGQVTYIQ